MEYGKSIRIASDSRLECDKYYGGGTSIYKTDGSADAKTRAETRQQETTYIIGYRDLYSSCAAICNHLPKNSMNKESLEMYVVSCSVLRQI